MKAGYDETISIQKKELPYVDGITRFAPHSTRCLGNVRTPGGPQCGRTSTSATSVPCTFDSKPNIDAYLRTTKCSAFVARCAAISPQRTDPGKNLRTPGFSAETTTEVLYKVQPGFHGAVQPFHDRLQIPGNRSRLVSSQLSPGPVQQLQVLIQ